jgi:hypothetical protein
VKAYIYRNELANTQPPQKLGGGSLRADPRGLATYRHREGSQPNRERRDVHRSKTQLDQGSRDQADGRKESG